MSVTSRARACSDLDGRSGRRGQIRPRRDSVSVLVHRACPVPWGWSGGVRRRQASGGRRLWRPPGRAGCRPPVPWRHHPCFGEHGKVTSDTSHSSSSERQPPSARVARRAARAVADRQPVDRPCLDQDRRLPRPGDLGEQPAADEEADVVLAHLVPDAVGSRGSCCHSIFTVRLRPGEVLQAAR